MEIGFTLVDKNVSPKRHVRSPLHRMDADELRGDWRLKDDPAGAVSKAAATLELCTTILGPTSQTRSRTVRQIQSRLSSVADNHVENK